MAPSLTPFCPSCPDITTGGGTPHTDIQAQFPTAPYCPHCNQFFSNAPINNARSNNPIDLTADSPNPRRRVKPSQQALTVPTSRPPPENYQMAIFQAQYNREESIQQDHGQAGQKSPSTTESIVIHIQALAAIECNCTWPLFLTKDLRPHADLKLSNRPMQVKKKKSDMGSQ
ncbi:hypothetical protein EDB80DRAFT_692095 [Ilyonectria destructans]|nr:hypothetical protein EDB80DRAFT_692758 [Ilyonectria destructans]KAH6981389.1 hypothetical protein EDB80DRAFT_692095 [Ilyonectria destructans]